MKNNIDYYRHKTHSHDHWKFKALRREFGWAGEGKFWALNNMIADAENCRLDLATEKRKKHIAADLDFSPPDFEKYIHFLEHDCELIINEDGFITTEMTQDVLRDVTVTRKRKREWKQKNSGEKEEKDGESKKVDVYSDEKDGENQHSIVQDSIVQDNNSKEVIIEGSESPAVPAESPIEIRKAKGEYFSCKKTKALICAFIKEKRPAFIEPYLDLWNIFAEEKKMSKVKTISESRKRKFNVRIKEDSFDFFEILKMASRSNFILESNWFNWDYIFENDTNYLKVIEGKYENDKPDQQINMDIKSTSARLQQAKENKKRYEPAK